MGQFSWLDCDMSYERCRQIIDNKEEDVYVLVPEEFGGGHFKEELYDGYGHFGGKDIFDLVADWNKDYINIEDYKDRTLFKNEMFNDYISGSYTDEELRKKHGDDYKRLIGITLACYDADNANLRYPIKITHRDNLKYENATFSLADPNQGWPYYKEVYDDVTNEFYDEIDKDYGLSYALEEYEKIEIKHKESVDKSSEKHKSR